MEIKVAGPWRSGGRDARRVPIVDRRRRSELTCHCRTKVERVFEHAVCGEMAAAGCLFVVCALRRVNDEIVARLEKGHTTAEVVFAIDLLR
jgi:hypothetical protein